jgi:hypothetical protein
MDDARRDALRYRLEQAERSRRIEAGEDAGDAGADTDADAPPPRRPTAAERAAVIETEIQQAIRRGDFDDLPGAGKPLEGLGGRHDPDWWIRRKIEREQLGGLGPPALTLRVEHDELDERIDRMPRESEVREAVEDFNRRVVEARRQLQGGPPVVTPTRDVDAEVRAWRQRRADRERAVAAAREAEAAAASARETERRATRRARIGRLLRRG